MSICTEWSLDDLYEAHAVLDLYDELERKQNAAEAAALDEARRGAP